MIDEGVFYILIFVFLGAVGIAMIIHSSLNKRKRKMKDDAIASSKKEKDRFYDGLTNEIFVLNASYSIVGNELKYKDGSMIKIKEEDQSVGLCMKWSFTLSDGFLTYFENSLLRGFEQKDNITKFSLQFVLTKHSNLANIAQNDDIDNCIIICPVRPQSTVYLFIKENGKINLNKQQYADLHRKNRSELMLYNLFSIDDSNSYLFGSVTCNPQDSKSFSDIFCIMANFDPDYKYEPYEYDY